MKKTLLLLLSTLLFSCSEEQVTKPTQESQSKIGDVTKTPDLYIPELENGWKGYGIRPDGTYGDIDETIGLRVPNYKASNNSFLTQDSYAVVIPYGETRPMLNYSCYLANGAPLNYGGQNDFVVDRVEDGIPEEGSGDYNFPGMISIVTFQNGLPIGEVIKQSFWVAPNNEKIGFDSSLAIDYRAINPNNMVIYAQTADLYFNKAYVNQGKNLIVVEINPIREINESNYNNNVSTLPVSVNLSPVSSWIGVGTLDLSAIAENQTHPATNVVVTKKFTGKDKFVKLDFSCPYHEPIYVKHWFTIKKNGVIVADHLHESEYVETVKGNYRTANYEIIVNVTGLGASVPTNVTVVR